MTNKLRLTACRIRTARGLVSRKNVKTARKPGGKPVTAVLGHFSAIHYLYYERPCGIEYTCNCYRVACARVRREL